MSNHDPKQIQCTLRPAASGSLTRGNLQWVLENLYDAIDALSPGGGYNYGQNPDIIPTVPNAANDEFEVGGLDTTGTRFTGATAWAWYQQSASTVSITGKGFAVIGYSSADTTNTLRGIEQVAPSPPWTYRAKVFFGTAHIDNFTFFGLYARGSGSWYGHNPAQLCGIGYSNDHIFIAYEDPGFFLHSWKISPHSHRQRSGFYLEIENDGTNLHHRVSGSGVDDTFYELLSFPLTANNMGGVVNYIGLGFYVSGNAAAISGNFVCEWFRRIA